MPRIPAKDVLRAHRITWYAHAYGWTVMVWAEDPWLVDDGEPIETYGRANHDNDPNRMVSVVNDSAMGVDSQWRRGREAAEEVGALYVIDHNHIEYDTRGEAENYEECRALYDEETPRR